MTDTPTPITDYISTKEASERTGLSRPQITRLLNRGLLRGRKIGNYWAIVPSSLDDYLANRPKPGIKLGQKLGPRRKAVSS